MEITDDLSFDSWFQSLETVDVLAGPKVPGIQELAEEIQKRRSRTVYTMLQEMEDPLPFDWVYWNDWACGQVGKNALGCSLRAFQALMKQSQLDQGQLAHLLVWAVELDRPDHLMLVLERLRAAGSDVKHIICEPEGMELGAVPADALAAAVENRSLRCVRRLLQAPEAEPVWSPRLLELWAQGNKGDEKLDRCLRAVARAWMPDRLTRGGPLPLVPGLELCHALEQQNPTLALRIIETRGVELPQAQRVLDAYGGILARREFHGLLSQLLTAWPQLLRRRKPALVLVMAALLPQEGPSPELEPWLRRLRRRKHLALEPIMEWFFFQYQKDSEEWHLNWRMLLERWKERLGERPAPALLRNVPVCGLEFRETWPVLVRHCQIRGAVPKGGASFLARQLVQCCTVRQVREALEPGGALEGEDLGFLLRECMWGPFPEDRAKRAILLAKAR